MGFDYKGEQKMSTIKQVLTIVILSSFLIISIYLSFNLYKVKTPEYTICELVPSKEGEDEVLFDAKFEYFVSSKKYSFKENRDDFQFNVIGEKFILKYDKNKPKLHEIISYKPLFLEDEKTAFTKGVIEKVHIKKISLYKNKSKYCIVYSYSISNYKYRKAQDIEPGLCNKKYLDSLKNNNIECEVQYWIENPRRAIINIGIE
jgi:hypothetical protein